MAIKSHPTENSHWPFVVEIFRWWSPFWPRKSRPWQRFDTELFSKKRQTSLGTVVIGFLLRFLKMFEWIVLKGHFVVTSDFGQHLPYCPGGSKPWRNFFKPVFGMSALMFTKKIRRCVECATLPSAAQEKLGSLCEVPAEADANTEQDRQKNGSCLDTSSK